MCCSSCCCPAQQSTSTRQWHNARLGAGDCDCDWARGIARGIAAPSSSPSQCQTRPKTHAKTDDWELAPLKSLSSRSPVARPCLAACNYGVVCRHRALVLYEEAPPIEGTRSPAVLLVEAARRKCAPRCADAKGGAVWCKLRRQGQETVGARSRQPMLQAASVLHSDCERTDRASRSPGCAGCTLPW